ncbi:hypothetical protein B0H16DRAFT_1562642 [Mycena metata]|uniref:F-box domain-containing protein n=1 Tax=Mycena metata TaxID=1033252 RepID=A0AAD7IH69_9AGAR|nr:hypothetical protein B0H16DRAFT_1562642 [Mycena metata]
MVETFPLEVVDLVIRRLNLNNRAERRAIGHCGLVCLDWCRSSRLHLFSEVTLSDSNIPAFLEVIANSAYPIRTFVRRLCLALARPGANLDQLIGRLGPLPAVTALRCLLHPKLVFLDHITRLASICPALTHLTLANPEFSYRYEQSELPPRYLTQNPLPMHFALDAIQRFPSLTYLALHHVELHHSEGAMYRFPIQLKTLDLQLHRSFLEEFFKNTLYMNTIPVFSSLYLLGVSPTPDTFTGKYLCYVGDRLRRLRLDMRSLHLSGTCVEVLQFCTGLRDLDLQAVALSPDTLLSQILPSLHCPNLTHITFADSHEFGGGYYSRDLFRLWGQVDDVLATNQFRGLLRFSIVSRSALVERIPEFMPRSRARRILQVATSERRS